MRGPLDPLLTVIGFDVASRARRLVRSAKWRKRLYRKMAARFVIGQSFMSTIRRLADQAHLNRPATAECWLLSNWAERMENQGEQIDSVLTGYLPSDELLIIAAAPNDHGVRRAMWLVDKKLSQTGSLLAVLLHPVLLIGILILMLMIIGENVLPNAIQMQVARGVPPSYEFQWFALHAWLIPIPLVILGILLKQSFPIWRGRMRKWFDRHVWPWTVYRKSQGTSFLFSFAAMQVAGLNEIQALYAIAEKSTPWMRQQVRAIAYHAEDGVPLGQAMHATGYVFPDQETIDDITDIQSSTEEMGSAMISIAEESSAELAVKFNSVVTIMNVVIMAFVAAAIVLIIQTILSALDIGAILEAVGSGGGALH